MYRFKDFEFLSLGAMNDKTTYPICLAEVILATLLKKPGMPVLFTVSTLGTHDGRVELLAMV